MRKGLFVFIGSLAMAFSGHALAYCGGGGCESEEICNPYETNCQCTDPICSRPAYSDCISRAYCCEAFGNIGAR